MTNSSKTSGRDEPSESSSEACGDGTKPAPLSRISPSPLSHEPQTLDSILGFVAHELRNPLSGIATGLRALGLTVRDPQSTRMHDLMERHIRNAQRLIEDMLDIARIQSGRFAIARAKTVLSSVVNAAVLACQDTIAARKQQLQLEVPTPDCSFIADEGRLIQVLTNLLDNASKFTPDGGGITLAAGCDAGEVSLAVRDTGAGIDRSRIEDLGIPFSKLEGKPAHPRSGLGLGLFLTQSILSAHGGRLEAASDGLNQGSLFVATIPESHVDEEG